MWVSSRSCLLKMAVFDRSFTTSYWSAIVHVSMALTCITFELLDVKEYRDHRNGTVR